MPHTTSGWRIRLLGCFGVEYDGDPVAVTVTAARLLALLALRERGLTRAELAGLLWGDSTEQQALASLRTSLWRLPRDRSSSLTLVCRDLVALDPGVVVDVRQQAAATAALVTGEDIRPDELSVQLSDELLPGWYDDWVIVAQERNRQLQLHTLEALSAWLREHGAFADAIDVGLRAVEREPLRESAHRCVIAAHLAEGNGCEARRHLAGYLDLLRAFGINPRPSAQLQAMMDADRAPAVTLL